MRAFAFLLLTSVASATVAQTAPVVEEKSIDQLRAMMAAGTSSEAITQAYLARIAAMDRSGPTLRAVIATNPDAITEARASDARRKAGTALGPLDGVPVLIKDNIETKDPIATTAGSLALKDNVTLRRCAFGGELASAGCGDPGQNQPQRMGQYPIVAFDQRVERGRGPRPQPLCARSYIMWVIERIGRGGGGEFRGGGGGDRDRWIGGLPLLDERVGWAEADAGVDQSHACRADQP